MLFRVKWFDTSNEGRKVKHFLIRNNITQISACSVSFKDQPYILVTHVKQVLYLKDPDIQPLHWKVIQDVNDKKYSNGDVIVVEDDHDVISENNLSDLELSTNLNDLEFATLNIDGQSTKVEAPPPTIHVDDDDDFISDEDDVPRDLVDSDNEFLANSHDLANPDKRPLHWKVVQDVNHKKYSNGDFIVQQSRAVTVALVPVTHLVPIHVKLVLVAEFERDESHQYPSLLASFYDLHTRKGVWLQEESFIQYGKQRGHIAGRGRQVADAGKKKVFGSQPREAKAYWRQLDEVLDILKTDPRMAELLSHVGSRSEIDSCSETGGRGGEGGSGESGDDDEGQ
nr:hypothetical protein [Tanacetum cinerariifolium]